MSLDGALSIANSGLRNISARMQVVSDNIANAGSTGYAVETVQQSSMVAGSAPEGVFTGNTVRDVDIQAQANVLTENAIVSGAQTTLAALQPIGSVNGTVGAGTDLASLVGDLQDSFATLSNDPGNVAQQNAVVDAATTLTTGINRLAQAYGTARQAAQDDIFSSVTTLNQSLDSIGQLNAQIVAAQGAGESTANLANLRDAAVQTLSGLLDIKVEQQTDGSIRVITTSGISLPLPTRDDNQSPFATSDTTVLPDDTTANGSIPAVTMNGADVTSQLTGGSLGADISLRDTTLPTYQATLDAFSENLANRFSGQGLKLFTNSDGTIPAAGGTPTQQNYVGFANTITVNPAVVTAPSLVRDGTTAIAGSSTGAAAFTPNPSGGPAGFETLIQNVLNYSFGSQAQAGVSYPSIPTTGLGVNGNLSVSLGQPATLGAFASALVSGQAQDLGQAGSDVTNETAVQTTLNTQLSQSTGVDIDTELSNMLQLQNAYGANAKILTAIQAMYNDLANVIS